MERTNHWAALYFIILMTFGNYVLFNLLVAILVEGFKCQVWKEANIIKDFDNLFRMIFLLNVILKMRMTFTLIQMMMKILTPMEMEMKLKISAVTKEVSLFFHVCCEWFLLAFLIILSQLKGREESWNYVTCVKKKRSCNRYNIKKDFKKIYLILIRQPH